MLFIMCSTISIMIVNVQPPTTTFEEQKHFEAHAVTVNLTFFFFDNSNFRCNLLLVSDLSPVTEINECELKAVQIRLSRCFLGKKYKR